MHGLAGAHKGPGPGIWSKKRFPALLKGTLGFTAATRVAQWDFDQDILIKIPPLSGCAVAGFPFDNHSPNVGGLSLTLRPKDHPECLTAYLVGDVEAGLLCKCVDQQEHGVDPKAEGEEGDNLGACSIEGDPDEGGKTHAGSNSDGDEDDSGQTETS